MRKRSTNREPLYPHTPKKKEPLFPHEPKGQQSQSLKHFWVEKNLPYDTWAIVEAWPGGTVRSPFETKEKAVKQEEEITEGVWKIKQVPSPQEKFPKQHEALKKLYPYEFIEYHDDGDLTIQLLVPPKAKPWPVSFRELVKGDVIVVTTDGRTFKEELLARTEGNPISKYSEINQIVADLNLLREERVWIDTFKTKGASLIHLQSGETATIIEPPEDFTSSNYADRAMHIEWADGSEMVVDSNDFAPSALQKQIAEITHGKPIPKFQ